MTNLEMRKMINSCAKSAKKSHNDSFAVKSERTPLLEINNGLPYVAIGEYFFQGEEASDLLYEAMNTASKFGVSVENAIIWQSQGW